MFCTRPGEEEWPTWVNYLYPRERHAPVHILSGSRGTKGSKLLKVFLFLFLFLVLYLYLFLYLNLYLSLRFLPALGVHSIVWLEPNLPPVGVLGPALPASRPACLMLPCRFVWGAIFIGAGPVTWSSTLRISKRLILEWKKCRKVTN